MLSLEWSMGHKKVNTILLVDAKTINIKVGITKTITFISSTQVEKLEVLKNIVDLALFARIELDAILYMRL